MAIETASTSAAPSVFDVRAERPRLKDVSILAMDMYFPKRVRSSCLCRQNCLLIVW